MPAASPPAMDMALICQALRRSRARASVSSTWTLGAQLVHVLEAGHAEPGTEAQPCLDEPGERASDRQRDGQARPGRGVDGQQHDRKRGSASQTEVADLATAADLRGTDVADAGLVAVSACL